MQIAKLVTVAGPPSLGTYANCKVGHRSRTPFSGRLCKFQSWSPLPDPLLWVPMQIAKLVTVAGPPSLGTYANCKVGHRSGPPSPNFKVGHRSRTPFSGYLCKLQTVAGPPSLGYRTYANCKVGHRCRDPLLWVPMQIAKLVTVAGPPSLGTYANCKVGHRSRTPFSGYLCKLQSWSPLPDPPLGTYANCKVGHHCWTPFSGYLCKLQSWSP